METEIHCNKVSSIESIYFLQIESASFDFKTLQQHLLKGTWFALVGEKNPYLWKQKENCDIDRPVKSSLYNMRKRHL